MVLPMGWSWSVWVAQTLAVAIGQRAEQLLQQQDDGWQTHLEYIDNFIAVGRNNDDASRMTQAIKKAAAECGAVLKPTPEEPVTEEVILGMKCDFTNKTVCVKPDWVKKFQELTTLFLLSPGRNSLKTAWKVLGNVIWGMRVLGIRQLSFPHLKLWMSRQAKKLAKKETTWRDRCNWWPAALKELREIVRIIVNNKPVHVSKLVSASEDTLWADASGSGGGYILERQGVERAFKWTRRWVKQKIHLLEAEALRRGVVKWCKRREKEEKLSIMTDSMLVFYALHNKKAKGVLFSRILDSICKALDGCEWTVHWVPSACQKADKLSRHFS